MRTLRWLGLVLVGALACGGGASTCREGTIFLELALEGGAASADALDVSVEVEGGSAKSSTVARAPGGATGSVEIDFPSGYPQGQRITVTVVARHEGAVVGSGSEAMTAAGTCGRLALPVHETATADAQAAPDDAGAPDAESDGPADATTDTAADAPMSPSDGPAPDAPPAPDLAPDLAVDAPPCGKPGQACCPGAVCQTGLCQAGSCVACGGPGQPCCGTSCNAGQVCGTTGTCQACGGPNQPCCTSGCTDATTVCAVGRCVGCGGTGQPCCTGNRCSGSGEVCHGGTCGSCGGQGQPCCPGSSGSTCAPGFACSGTACTACGGVGEPCCGTSCDTGALCTGGKCAACGGVGQPCCGSLCGGDSLCSGGKCVACGGRNQPCCAGSRCLSSGDTCAGGQCTACGGSGQPCCASGCSGNTQCQGGTCTPCGGVGQACCPGATCGAGARCNGNQCQACGGIGQVCCSGANVCLRGQTRPCGNCNLGTETCSDSCTWSGVCANDGCVPGTTRACSGSVGIQTCSSACTWCGLCKSPATCNGSSGGWDGCRGTGCWVCKELLAGFDCYLANHPNCVENSTCNGSHFTCNADCPAPTADDVCKCSGVAGGFQGCRGSGCGVCDFAVKDYACYFAHHPGCQKNTTCDGFIGGACAAHCPAPTEADKGSRQ